MTNKKLAIKTEEVPILLDSIYCLHRIGDHGSADAVLKESRRLIESSDIYSAIGTLIELIGQYQQSALKTNEFARLKNIEKEISLSDIPLYRGWFHFLHGYCLKQAGALEKAIEFFKEGLHFSEMCEAYYWMDKFKCLPMDEKIHSFIRLYPIKSVFSVLMGNNFYSEEVAPLTIIEKQQMAIFDHGEEDFDCWIIKDENIFPAHYHATAYDDENFLDLYSGLINDRGEYTFLLISELNCLSFLLGSQLVGTTATSVAEFLGRTEEEAIAILSSLKKMGIPIVQEKDQYVLEWKKKPIIIVPRKLKVIGLQEYVRKKKKMFSKAQLVELLQLTQFGAEALLRKWALSGFIKPEEGPDKSTLWTFV